MMDLDKVREAVRSACGLHLDADDTADEVVRVLSAGPTPDELVGQQIATRMIAQIDAACPPAPLPSDAIIGVMAALAAAISLLERTPQSKKAASSDRMFDQMLVDYRKALDDGRAALSSSAGPAVEPDGEIVMFEGVGKEVSWRKGKMPPAGSKLYAHPAPATVEMLREPLKDCAQWLDVILAEKVVVEPANEQHIAASVARARAALAPATEGRKG